MFAELQPRCARLLDVGCGDGLLSSEIARLRADVTLEGVDVLVRKNTFITVAGFDGEHIPHRDGSFDAVMLVGSADLCFSGPRLLLAVA